MTVDPDIARERAVEAYARSLARMNYDDESMADDIEDWAALEGGDARRGDARRTGYDDARYGCSEEWMELENFLDDLDPDDDSYPMYDAIAVAITAYGDEMDGLTDGAWTRGRNDWTVAK